MSTMVVTHEIINFVPCSWFLEETTRVEAEEILNRSNGNVLMRKHSSYAITGRYIISYQKDASSYVSVSPTCAFLDSESMRLHVVTLTQCSHLRVLKQSKLSYYRSF